MLVKFISNAQQVGLHLPKQGQRCVNRVCHVQIHLTDARSSMSRGLPSFEVKKLSTIMKELGHQWVDVLKIDIEGNEWPVLEGMIKDKEPFMFTQMQVHYSSISEILVYSVILHISP